MTSQRTVYFVEDDDALRLATTRLLTACGFAVRAFASADEFLTVFDPDLTGCLLLDLRMPGKSGLELQRELDERGPHMPIVFLTGHADVPTSVYAMKHGAVDFLEKPVREEELTAAIERALERDAQTRATRKEVAELERRYGSLTPREREIFAEMVAGQRNKQAAFSLGISERTVKLHRARVLEKMGAPTLADLVRMAERLDRAHGAT
jgi:two-component system, LuxR family, response regulator FixJ